MKVRSLLERLFGPMFLKHHVNPFFVKGKRVPLPSGHWEKLHEGGAEVSAAGTIRKDYPVSLARYHYDAVEDSLLALAASGKIRLDAPRVLDVGAGSGHWIDFYRRKFGASEVTGLELSAALAGALRTKYAGVPGVEILEGDLSRPGLDLGRKYNLINAIGVLFHVADDAQWLEALNNLSRHLEPDGAIVAGGWFGFFTRDVQFVEKNAPPGQVWAHKRLRSRRRWEEGARRAGLRVAAVRKTRRLRNYIFPENNVLVLKLAAH